MKETKIKYAIYLYPSQMEEIKSLVEQGAAKSQSEFVSDAIHFYVGYLQQDKHGNAAGSYAAACRECPRTGCPTLSRKYSLDE